MNDEVIKRVDTWLASRGITPGTDTCLRLLALAWGTLRDTWPRDNATGAAMCGVLLGLVAEAWGDPYAYVDPEAFDGPNGHAVWLRSDKMVGRGQDDGDALASALEGSPCN